MARFSTADVLKGFREEMIKRASLNSEEDPQLILEMFAEIVKFLPDEFLGKLYQLTTNELYRHEIYKQEFYTRFYLDGTVSTQRQIICCD